MAVFKRKTKNESVENHSQEESRSPNHWTYNDDPLLNIEPVFTDDPNAKSIKIEDIAKQSLQEFDNNSDVSSKIKELRSKIGASPKPEVGGILGSIINGAREKSQIIQNEVIENDPVIAKLQKIEELKRTGGVDADLYTDVSKIQNSSVNYSQRAKAFHEENSTKILESDLERAKRLAREAQEAREFQRDNSEKTISIIKVNQDKTVDIKENILNSTTKKISRIDNLEKEVKDKIKQLIEIKKRHLDQDAEETIQDLNSFSLEDELKREKFLTKKLKEFDSLLKDNEQKKHENILIKPRRLQKVKDKEGDSSE